jgi:hypothetical protein
VNVSSIFVGRETGEIVAVGDGDGAGEGDDVGAGVKLSLNAEEVGDACVGGEISFCRDGVGVLLGVADCAVFDGVGAGDLRAPDAELFDFALGVGVGLGTGVCALRSTPM